MSPHVLNDRSPLDIDPVEQSLSVGTGLGCPNISGGATREGASEVSDVIEWEGSTPGGDASMLWNDVAGIASLHVDDAVWCGSW